MPSRRMRPTLLISGIAGGSLSLWLLQKRLRRAGIHAERFGLPIILRHSVAFYAEKLRKRIAKLFEKTGKKVTLVGWSMGGLISVEAVSDPETAALVRRIITFGTPFDGSYPAYAAAHRPGQLFLSAPKEIVPGSETLRRLQSTINESTRSWELVTINGYAILDPLAPGPLQLVSPDIQITDNFSHGALFANRQLHRLVAKLVLIGPLTAFS